MAWNVKGLFSFTRARLQASDDQANTSQSPQKCHRKRRYTFRGNHDSNSRNVLPSIVLVLAGIVCFLYPVASTLWNNHTAKEISAAYDKFNHDQAGDVRRENLRKARAYNVNHKGVLTADPYNGSQEFMNKPEYRQYERVLDEPMGVMGVVKIPKIGVKLPIYHGTSDEVLARGAGHLFGTDLPVGGKNRHTVITAHTGLASSTMFDALTDLKHGDSFYVDVQGETLRYKVFRINVIKPEDISLLQREHGRDLATLLTCTPYGVNSHRLIVTGERVLPDPVKAPEDRVQLPLWMVLFMIAMLLALLILITMLLALRRNRKLVKGQHVSEQDALVKL